MVEEAISVHQDLRAVAADALKLRHQPSEIGGWQGEQKPVAGPIGRGTHPP